MIVVPIGSYFLTVNTIFAGKLRCGFVLGPAQTKWLNLLTGNATYSGGFAAIMANVVLVAYIIVAMREDQTDQIEAEEKRKKAQ